MDATTNTILTFSLIIFSLLYVSTPSASAAGATTTTPAANFIRTSCRATTYPAVCVNSLSTYAASINKSPKQLVTTALTVSVDKAQSTKSFVAKLTKFRGLKPREYSALKDCLEEISDSVDRLSKSVKELKNMGRAKGPEFIWHMSNLQTWVSAALTDESTCVDGFAGRALNGRIKSSIKARMTNVAQVTSNALALCNKYAGKY
ncbi:Plant invertase/pectin methylesterase inhibitor superfamily protein [Perilla frutescens var. hirtella]|uniref:Plant invertase/pectin methylesterase inhibitor superfamily protein n=1 Tax=Perilla frutescens var. hirtella TaxID=608512 RepID=A0AAD4P745_PERFH|nr:Plant invertase/pectin methylesterase inhibitor superfamily protein [Perilla frutescens var. hirtella]